MNKRLLAVIVMILMTAMLAMASCSSSEFGGVVENEKEMNITAENADVDDMVTTGTLVVGDNEQITIDSNLEKGGIRIEFIASEGNEDIEEVPDLEGVEAAYTTEVKEVESQAVMFGGGSYIVRATVTEKATGTVNILVKGFEDWYKWWHIHEEELNADLDAKTRTTVFVYSDAQAEDKAFTLDVINMTDSTKKISETDVMGFSVGSSSTACKSVTMKKAGVLIDVSDSDAGKATGEALKKAYGTTEEVGYADNSDEDNKRFSWNFSSLIPDDQKPEGYTMGISEGTRIGKKQHTYCGNEMEKGIIQHALILLSVVLISYTAGLLVR